MSTSKTTPSEPTGQSPIDFEMTKDLLRAFFDWSLNGGLLEICMERYNLRLTRPEYAGARTSSQDSKGV